MNMYVHMYIWSVFYKRANLLGYTFQLSRTQRKNQSQNHSIHGNYNGNN